MASQGFYDWVKAGKPYALIRPAAAVQANIRRHGLTVYDFPNAAHLQAPTPEDHTPFSVTGFPGANKRWHARALDIMPRSGSAAHRKENADIARQLIRDRDAGVPGTLWIKYINWTAENGTCQQERWTTVGAPLKRTTKSSSDAGHIHVSGRSDADDDARADAYDPVLRMQVTAQTPPGGPVELASILPDPKAGTNVGAALASTWKGVERIADGPNATTPTGAHVWLAGQLGDIKAAVVALPSTGGGWTQEQRDALADDLATRVFDKLATKLGDALINALTDPRAVEAYRQGANAAEDS